MRMVMPEFLILKSQVYTRLFVNIAPGIVVSFFISVLRINHFPNPMHRLPNCLNTT